MINAWAKPGVKCVCVNDIPGAFRGRVPANVEVEWHLMDGLTKGRIYTVREVYFDPDFRDHMVRLVEIDRPLLDDEEFETGYAIERFRPLVTRTQQQDVALFTHILDRLPIEIDA